MHRHLVVLFSFVTMVVNLGNLFASLKIHWNHLRRLAQPYLNYEYDRCLDLIMLCGGIRPVVYTEPWKRRCVTLYRLLGYYQFAMSLARVGFSIRNQDDLVELVAVIAAAMGVVICFVKVYNLKHYEDVIRQSKVFLSSNTGQSGDPEYDASVRQSATRTAGKLTFAIFCLICCDQVLLWVPNSARDRILAIPKQFHVLGPMASGLLQEAYVLTLFTFWGSRLYCTTLTVLPILMGLRSELMVVARRFETIEDQLQTQATADHNNAMGTSRKVPSYYELRCKHLKRILETSVEQHVEVLRNMQLLQPAVSQIYAIIYYTSMTTVSFTVLLAIRCGVSLVSIVLVLSSSIFVLECYFWCQLTESFQESTEKIADAVTQLSFRLEHSVDSHSEYIQMRTSLMIVQLNASRGEWFSCGGVFPISVESFGNLCMIIYRFATFLMDLD